MKLLLTLIIMLCAVSALSAPTGRSKTCDDIGYLSTSCMDVEVMPMEYKDKDVALAKAEQDITQEAHVTKIYNFYNSVEKDEDGITITANFEEVE